jgi:DNA repair protein RadC
VKALVLFAIGGSVGTSVEVRDVFAPLMRLRAASFVLIHTHPSGNPSPSPEDVELTNALVRAGRVLGIALVDHLVIASGGVVSFYDTGLLPTDSELNPAPVLHEHG